MDTQDFLSDIARQVGERILDDTNKRLFKKHIVKVIIEAEKYRQYLHAEQKKAKAKGLTQYDENRSGGVYWLRGHEGWFWWTPERDLDKLPYSGVYFPDIFDSFFYIEGDPKPDPLDYLISMVFGCVGQEYNGLECLDYQFVLLAIIHDAQSWQAGRQRIYFSKLGDTLPDRLCRAIWNQFESEDYQNPYNFKDVRDTISTSLSAIKTNTEQKLTKTSGGKREDVIQATSETTKTKINPTRDQVFICYSHKDEKWLDELQKHLKPYVRNGSVTAWSDRQITPGSHWLPEIEAALASSKVAVLLVTPDFLASDFIHEHELGPLLKKAEKDEMRIIWVPVRASAYNQTPLKNYQAAIGPDKPLANMKANRDKAWVKICEEIKKAVSR